MILQRIRIIVGEAGFEPEKSGALPMSHHISKWTHITWKKRFEENFVDLLKLKCWSFWLNNYLSEIETEFENTLACLSVAQMGSNHEKNWRPKILWHTLSGRKSTNIFSFEIFANKTEDKRDMKQVLWNFK